MADHEEEEPGVPGRKQRRIAGTCERTVAMDLDGEEANNEEEDEHEEEQRPATGRGRGEEKREGEENVLI